MRVPSHVLVTLAQRALLFGLPGEDDARKSNLGEAEARFTQRCHQCQMEV
jgi:hypothetical protein